MTDGDHARDVDNTIDQFRARARQWLVENAATHGWVREAGAGAASATRSRDDVAAAKEAQRTLFEAGFVGISWPKEYGGAGLGLREQIAFNLEAAEYDIPIGMFIIGVGMCGPTLLTLGTQEQKDRYVRPLLRGDEVWCQLFSEPGAGSDVAGLRTRAVRDGDHWVLSGQKVWTSGAQRCDFGLVLARTDPTAPKHKGISMFILDMKAPGVEIRPIKQMNGGAHFNEVFFDDVVIPAENLIGEVNEGWTAAITTLMNERVSLGSVRPLEDTHEAATLFELARSAGRADDGAVRQELIDVWIRERLTVLLGERVVSTVLMGRKPGPEGSVVKLVRGEYTRRSALLGAELAGASAVAWPAGDAHGARFSAVLLHVPSLSIAGGTDEVLRNVIGERVLGLPREPQVDRDAPFNELVSSEGVA